MTTVSNTSPCGSEKLDATRADCISQHMSKNESSVTGCNFDCSICLEESREPVVTMCGHLFCWSCLHQWITIHSVLEECPVCKTCVKDKIIPLYGRGKTGLTKLESKKVHPHRPSPHPHPSTASTVPRDAGFQYFGQQQHGLISRENYTSRGLYPSSSVGAFGIFPALFGVHTVASLDQNVGYPPGSSYNSMTFRMPAINSISSQQRRLNAQQEFVLYWFLILLAGFAISCFLLF
ncbi:hypothetical protein GOP47_0007906 [Adiantum capillus-veneris]|uniref:RING-type E3 ubiquitin transferase n=1 Tax=Adiantum capillus-veneris TaxID=13818 RepID=A0A9D4ZLE2_ADICA|nr:hypothetical protein GOP47_0007906 [Adiantum capillus-veneris]